MSFLERLLDTPSYGWMRDGKFYKPTHSEILREWVSRMNVFANRKNWLPCLGWTLSLICAIPLAIFFVFYFSWPLALAGFLYSMVILGSHGTFWLHRHGTHRAFKFSNPVVRFFARNAVLKFIPEEIYILSHHVHHHISEKPGDPYNVHGGFLYCLLSDANHQMINPNMSEADYQTACKLMAHTGVKMNTYEQYKKWGTVAHPLRTVIHYALNWTFWVGTFYLIGGPALATCLLGASGVWAVGVRSFNYEGHGKGKDRRRDGIDFNRDDWSVNQVWPGYVAGEWHNNHHLYPAGARSGFQPYQIDIPWYWIAGLEKLGMVTGVRDYKEEFLQKYYLPYMKQKAAVKSSPEAAPIA